MSHKLEAELVPEALWGKSLRQQYPTQWKKLRAVGQAWAGRQCEICGGKGDRHPVEIHEIWEYGITEKKGLQRLIGLIALCPMCHAAKHYGRSAMVFYPDDLEKLRRHMIRVNGYTERDLNLSLDGARRVWEDRNELEWTQDLSRFFTEYECEDCDRTYDIRPVVAEEDEGRITKVEWLCKLHEGRQTRECYCHNVRLSTRLHAIEDNHDMWGDDLEDDSAEEWDDDLDEYGITPDGPVKSLFYQALGTR